MKIVFLKKGDYIVNENGDLSIKQTRNIDTFKQLVQCEVIIKKYEKERNFLLKRYKKIKEKKELLEEKYKKSNLKNIRLKKILKKYKKIS